MELLDNYEICGILDSIIATKYNLKLKFKVVKSVDLPLSALPVEKLQELKGQPIGIIRINGKYLLRRLSK